MAQSSWPSPNHFGCQFGNRPNAQSALAIEVGIEGPLSYYFKWRLYLGIADGMSIARVWAVILSTGTPTPTQWTS